MAAVALTVALMEARVEVVAAEMVRVDTTLLYSIAKEAGFLAALAIPGVPVAPAVSYV